MDTVSKEYAIRSIVRSAVKAYANGFSTRHLSEIDNDNGVINMKIHNVFIAALGKEIQYYSALARSLDSSLGNMLEKMAIKIATLNYEVTQEVEGPIYQEQTDYIAELLECYKNTKGANHKKPSIADYRNIIGKNKSAVYMNYRFLYNDAVIAKDNPKLHCALFYFMRNYAYSGMFRYSSSGEFNVPYGGIAYNSKMMSKKLNYYRSSAVLEHFAKAKIYNLDFEKFLNEVKPKGDDFIFLDPPYDSEFSTYAQKDFTRDDQRRLANYLLKKCKAKWMMIIKNTDFIYGLYDKPGINIRSFDKEYVVSFMNRNDRKVTHLLITNF